MIRIVSHLLRAIHAHGQAAYPFEGAGLLLGLSHKDVRVVTHLLPLSNAREKSAQHNRYLLTADDYRYGEEQAEQLGLSVIGVFHSHPDHPNQPSEFDREWAIPWFSYLITSVYLARPSQSRSWLLLEDRSGFAEEKLELIE